MEPVGLVYEGGEFGSKSARLRKDAAISQQISAARKC
jgi:hypothetical protein